MERIKNNWPIKLLSLIFAFGLWYYVISDANPEITKEFRNIELNIKNKEVLMQVDKDIVTPVNPTVYVKVRGSRDVISKLKESDIEAEVDINDIRQDLTSGVNEKRMLIKYNFPASVIKDDDTDIFIDFKFDNVISEEYDVKIEEIGNLPSDNLAIKDKEVVPGKVKITGQEKIMNKVDKVLVWVDISNETKDVTRTLPVEVYDKNGEKLEGLEISDKNVKVNMYISNSKQVPIKVNTVGSLPEELTLLSSNPSKEKVTILGDEKLLEKIAELETEPIDLSKVNNDENIAVRLVLPEGVELMKKEDISVDIMVKSKTEKESDLVTKTFTIKKEGIIALNNDKDYNIILPTDVTGIAVTLEGKEKTINEVKDSDIVLNIDIDGLWRGKHDVPVTMQYIKGVTNTIKPANITIELKK